MSLSSGGPPSGPAARLAATVLLLREQDGALQVFMVKRHHQVDFASGALVFPGGKLADGDRDPRLRQYCTGGEYLNDDERALRVGALREVFEECGVLLARRLGETAFVDPAVSASLGERFRGALERGETGMADIAMAEGLSWACDALVPFAHWVTPSFMPKRFDTWFYLAAAPAAQAALHDGRETVDSCWLRPADALAQAETGQIVMVPATALNVSKLARSSSIAEAFAAARAKPIVTVQPETVEGSANKRLRIPPEADYGVSEFAF